jgi:A/G-specific adenine glycosylase
MAVPTLASRTLRWYAGHARDLPWRAPGTSPWAVLVSEVMLQQTQVARVAPVWAAWMARWPEPAMLATEPPGEAIRAWGRLGYPRRALRLHACAQMLVVRHRGRVPADLAALLELPGVGGYTARAVAAFAFGQRHPVVDTNVRRLVARAVYGRPDGGASTGTGDLEAVTALLPRESGRAARVSVAFMELGALVCTARQPACPACPLRTVCRWRTGGRPPAVPRRPRGVGAGYAGTDRQVRGLLLAVVREAVEPVPPTRLELVWPDPVQRHRALASLLEDGLVRRLQSGCFALPGRG